MNNQEPHVETEAEKKDKRQQIDRFLNLWMHQNVLLWGRLQTIAVIQVGVIGGWYYLVFTEHSGRAHFCGLLLALLGCVLSYQVKELIRCDSDHRYHHSKKLRELDKEIFPELKDQMHGWQRIRSIARLFFGINILLTIYSFGQIVVFAFIWFCHVSEKLA